MPSTHTLSRPTHLPSLTLCILLRAYYFAQCASTFFLICFLLHDFYVFLLTLYMFSCPFTCFLDLLPVHTSVLVLFVCCSHVHARFFPTLYDRYLLFGHVCVCKHTPYCQHRFFVQRFADCTATTVVSSFSLTIPSQHGVPPRI